MQGSTHMAGGACAAVAYLLFVHPETIHSPAMILAAAGIGAAGGLVPDIDHPKSKISQVLQPIYILVSHISPHRGLFHTPLFYALIWFLWTWKCPDPKHLLWSRLLFTGIASHLFLDFLNPSGIPVFFPFSKKRRHIAAIRTGGKVDSVIRGFLSILLATLIAVLFFRGFPVSGKQMSLIFFRRLA